ncbi:MAG: cyclase family protein [Deltaproteobacteria bacterium]|jgi:kynurenine formamidase|nr:cyclase family protein [Deltaproteobacteria bacterium]MBT4265176.1 cyclase family protein [Deltaproteobacteria bacterium]MBT4638633.1 cyclase family protein [Deltaproteobacteria bacterium]MBT6503504.1 cyclase family protein [Deltaproteobacteria bacterium]MBT6611620.1 cyclase family protein [Deltaproteobacteria bacterium]
MKPPKIIDLSISLETGLPSDPPNMIPQIVYHDHKMGADQMLDFFPGIKKEQLPNEMGWALEEITLTTHSGTHLDAPYHYHPTMDKGKRALTIDEIPLDWCFSDGVLLDFSYKADGERISADDVKAELDRIGYQLKQRDIVLVRVGADRSWGKPEYLTKGAGMTRESTLYITEQGVKVVGIDAWSWDRPLPFLAEEFKQNGDPGIIWEAHFAGIENGYCHMEKLANLDKIPKPFGFKVSCFPVKIKAASAGWVRCVAIIDE